MTKVLKRSKEISTDELLYTLVSRYVISPFFSPYRFGGDRYPQIASVGWHEMHHARPHEPRSKVIS